jgi:uncharacterized membrane protein
MNRAELKSKAKAQIKGKIGILFLITLIVALVAGAIAAIPVIGTAISVFIVTPALSLSLIRVYLMVIKGKNPEVKDTFSGFDDFWSAFKVTFLATLYTFLWSLLFFIPGIVKAYSYSMSFYILAENPGMSAKECIKKSMEMTNGHKWELFVLELSFIGWMFLMPFTFGILGIWLLPYMSATFANAYESLKPVAVAPAVEEPVAEPT